MNYQPVDPEELEKARLVYEAANAYPKLLEQQRGYECQQNPYFKMLTDGANITVYETHYMNNPRKVESFLVDGIRYEPQENAELWDQLLALRSCPQVYWQDEMSMDWYSIYRAIVKGK